MKKGETALEILQRKEISIPQKAETEEGLWQVFHMWQERSLC